MQPPDAGSQRDRTATVSPDDIRKAQQALTAKGHNPGSVNGVMDSKTQQALRDFQKANNLPVTGTLDPQTAQKLGITLGSSAGAPSGGSQATPQTKQLPPAGTGSMK
jgi:peptidoglycan hydrolase-like protein with peptidoglycan-binding domain